jgi:ABC-type multidrug transport system ATPase subunit
MSTLANLAREENKLIFATIHQPSSLIFRSFDTLYLIHNGQTLFNGPAQNITAYMQRLGIDVD